MKTTLKNVIPKTGKECNKIIKTKPIINFSVIKNTLMKKKNLVLKKMEVKPQEALMELQAELDDRLFDLIETLTLTPFFMLKARWQLKARIETIKSTMKLVRIYQCS